MNSYEYISINKCADNKFNLVDFDNKIIGSIHFVYDEASLTPLEKENFVKVNAKVEGSIREVWVNLANEPELLKEIKKIHGEGIACQSARKINDYILFSKDGDLKKTEEMHGLMHLGILDSNDQKIILKPDIENIENFSEIFDKLFTGSTIEQKIKNYEEKKTIFESDPASLAVLDKVFKTGLLIKAFKEPSYLNEISSNRYSNKFYVNAITKFDDVPLFQIILLKIKPISEEIIKDVLLYIIIEKNYPIFEVFLSEINPISEENLEKIFIKAIEYSDLSIVEITLSEIKDIPKEKLIKFALYAFEEEQNLIANTILSKLGNISSADLAKATLSLFDDWKSAINYLLSLKINDSETILKEVFLLLLKPMTQDDLKSFILSEYKLNSELFFNIFLTQLKKILPDENIKEFLIEIFNQKIKNLIGLPIVDLILSEIKPIPEPIVESIVLQAAKYARYSIFETILSKIETISEKTLFKAYLEALREIHYDVCANILSRLTTCSPEHLAEVILSQFRDCKAVVEYFLSKSFLDPDGVLKEPFSLILKELEPEYLESVIKSTFSSRRKSVSQSFISIVLGALKNSLSSPDFNKFLITSLRNAASENQKIIFKFILTKLETLTSEEIAEAILSVFDDKKAAINFLLSIKVFDPDGFLNESFSILLKRLGPEELKTYLLKTDKLASESFISSVLGALKICLSQDLFRQFLITSLNDSALKNKKSTVKCILTELKTLTPEEIAGSILSVFTNKKDAVEFLLSIKISDPDGGLNEPFSILLKGLEPEELKTYLLQEDKLSSKPFITSILMELKAGLSPDLFRQFLITSLIDSSLKNKKSNFKCILTELKTLTPEEIAGAILSVFTNKKDAVEFLLSIKISDPDGVLNKPLSTLLEGCGPEELKAWLISAGSLGAEVSDSFVDVIADKLMPISISKDIKAAILEIKRKQALEVGSWEGLITKLEAYVKTIPGDLTDPDSSRAKMDGIIRITKERLVSESAFLATPESGNIEELKKWYKGIKNNLAIIDKLIDPDPSKDREEKKLLIEETFAMCGSGWGAQIEQLALRMEEFPADTPLEVYIGAEINKILNTIVESISLDYIIKKWGNAELVNVHDQNRIKIYLKEYLCQEVPYERHTDLDISKVDILLEFIKKINLDYIAETLSQTIYYNASIESGSSVAASSEAANSPEAASAAEDRVKTRAVKLELLAKLENFCKTELFKDNSPSAEFEAKFNEELANLRLNLQRLVEYKESFKSILKIIEGIPFEDQLEFLNLSYYKMASLAIKPRLKLLNKNLASKKRRSELIDTVLTSKEKDLILSSEKIDKSLDDEKTRELRIKLINKILIEGNFRGPKDYESEILSEEQIDFLNKKSEQIDSILEKEGGVELLLSETQIENLVAIKDEILKLDQNIKSLEGCSFSNILSIKEETVIQKFLAKKEDKKRDYLLSEFEEKYKLKGEDEYGYSPEGMKIILRKMGFFK